VPTGEPALVACAPFSAAAGIDEGIGETA